MNCARSVFGCCECALLNRPVAFSTSIDRSATLCNLDSNGLTRPGDLQRYRPGMLRSIVAHSPNEPHNVCDPPSAHTHSNIWRIGAPGQTPDFYLISLRLLFLSESFRRSEKGLCLGNDSRNCKRLARFHWNPCMILACSLKQQWS